MGLRNFEKRLEKMVEGAFARVFRSGLRPVEIGRRLTREMDDSRSIGVRGNTVVANDFTVNLSQQDADEFAEVGDSMRRNLAELAREHARDEGYDFMGPIGIAFEVDPKMRIGAFSVTARLREGDGGAGAGSLVLPNGDRFVLGETIVTIGRIPESVITLEDPNVSRNHAEIRPSGGTFVLADLGSTNGTKINGVKVSERLLQDGDEMTFGSTTFRFEAS
ncbi:FhaA domain-containing protein [Actinospongicola halichondriae]|uniref:FhaA domain-containing protein n=1 Tax=Actinospongicola halichondriae TaxID=3236844 RepID=UPI003D5784AE